MATIFSKFCTNKERKEVMGIFKNLKSTKLLNKDNFIGYGEYSAVYKISKYAIKKEKRIWNPIGVDYEFDLLCKLYEHNIPVVRPIALDTNRKLLIVQFDEGLEVDDYFAKYDLKYDHEAKDILMQICDLSMACEKLNIYANDLHGANIRINNGKITCIDVNSFTYIPEEDENYRKDMPFLAVLDNYEDWFAEEYQKNDEVFYRFVLNYYELFGYTY